MLPEFIDVYDNFMEQVESAIAGSHRKELVPFDQARSRVLYEGDDFERSSASDDSTWKHIEETVFLSHEEASVLTLEELIAKFAEIGTVIGQQTAQHHHEIIHNHAEKAGHLVHQEPDEELAETLLRLFEKTDREDDGDSFTLFMPPGQQEQFEEAIKMIEDTPHLNQRKQAIENAAFERRRSRQANRKLVD